VIENANDLVSRHCETLRYGASVVKKEEVEELLLAVPSWRREFQGGVEKLMREYHFVEFKDAFSFNYKIAALSNREDHHPSIITEWGKVTVYWWSHKVNGLHINDFIMAAKTDLIAKLAARP
jgi:4a-hydroxytetrahydrobiopterin dehydratase